MESIRVRLLYENEDYLNDVQDIPRAFAPYLIVDDFCDNYLRWTLLKSDEILKIHIESNVFGDAEYSEVNKEITLSGYKKLSKHFIKVSLYDFLSKKLNIVLPYGSLTGVRPTKLYYELSNITNNPKQYLVDRYKVSQSKAELIENCVSNQNNYINKSDDNCALFVNIPFCPSRCSYCAFMSTEVGKIKDKLPIYTENVLKEYRLFEEFINKSGLNVKSIYIGGGTPTSIGADYLNKLTTPLRDYGIEFTVEAGRPDTIDSTVLKILKQNGVTRISVNPQTFNQKTLDIIGRKHSVEQIYESYDLAKNYGFDINMDLIAGLTEETYEEFSYSVEECLKLEPDNITVHTLSLKRGSVMTLQGEAKEDFGKASKMLDYAYKRLSNNGYVPYYMYRQKNMADNLENTGFCKKGKQCIYNIDMMEESISVYGAGAGAINKKLCGNNRIERLSIPKGFNEYNNRIESILAKKYQFWS